MDRPRGVSVYYRQAKEKPSPLSAEFDRAYFERLVAAPEVRKLSAKAALATEQNIRTIREFQRRYERALAVLGGYEAALRGVLDENEDHLFYLLTVRFGQRVYGAYLAWAEEALALLAERNEETGA
ncbi:MAG: hypothetical protein GX493_04650 [Firmicutes bacterium]|nr:hypothetical protein [Bacillota bacterium]